MAAIPGGRLALCLQSMRWAGAGLLLAVVVLAPGATAGDEPVTLRVGTIAPEGSPYYDAAVSVGRTITKNTKGAVRLRIYPAAAMGDEAQLMGSVHSGQLEVYVGSAVAAFAQLPELAVFELPYLFSNEAEVDATFVKVWPQTRKALAARSYEGIGYSAVGFRHLWTKRPIGSLDDLRKLRIRSMPAPTYERFWKLAGVPAVAIGVPEVAPLLEQGALDGFEQAITFTFASSWHQYVKHLALTAHIFQPGVALIGPQGRARLPKGAAATMLAGVEVDIKESLRRVREVDRGLLASLPGVGVAVAPPPPELVRDLKAHAATVRAEWRKTAPPAGKKLYDTIEKLLAAARG